MTDRSARLGVDVGGTFTDIVIERAGRRTTHKVLTTRLKPEDGIAAGIRETLAMAGVAAEEISLLIHGTTLFTNALIERSCPPIAFLTTAGHRDTLEIATESRFHLYDLGIDKPAPLVPREWRLPVRERLAVDGAVLEQLIEDDVVAAAERIAAAGLGSAAVGFLHSYVNPAHEQRAAEILARRCPGLAITLSSDVSPEIREYDRFNTACANALVKPMAAAYLGALRARLADLGVRCPVFLMHSGGGMIDVETGLEQPIRLLESGPAGGATFTAAVARALGLDRVLCFDMGGTTAKICFVDDFHPRTARHFEVDRAYRFLKGSGLPVRIPVIEMVEIGAGGGSIAHIDRMGGLAVGPESAGADPGPACFGRGGTQPTVTDANLLLSRIRPDRFASGSVPLSPEKAAAAIEAIVAQPLGITPERGAAGIIEIVDENMANAARVHALEHGRDLSRYTLVAFGGAGPLHAGRLAAKLGIARIVVPADAGVGSAVGFLRAPLAFEILRSLPMRLSGYDAARVDAVVAETTARAEAAVARANVAGERQREVAAFMRYVGQGHELEVGIPDWAGPPEAAALRALFERAYEAMFARRLPGQEIEIISWRVRVSLRQAPEHPAVPDTAALGAAASDFRDEAAGLRVVERAALDEGKTLDGPAVIVDRGATIFVPPDFSATVAAFRHLVLQRRSAS